VEGDWGGGDTNIGEGRKGWKNGWGLEDRETGEMGGGRGWDTDRGPGGTCSTKFFWAFFIHEDSDGFLRCLFFVLLFFRSGGPFPIARATEWLGTAPTGISSGAMSPVRTPPPSGRGGGHGKLCPPHF